VANRFNLGKYFGIIDFDEKAGEQNLNRIGEKTTHQNLLLLICCKILLNTKFVDFWYNYDDGIDNLEKQRLHIFFYIRRKTKL
jgi:hypothetical protein